MVSPVPGKAVTTKFKLKGSFWKACGWHTGQDYAAKVGTKVVAARPGIVKHVNYGTAFGSKQVAVVCSDGSEDFYAHMRLRIKSGTRVKAGDKIGEVGSEGNVSGPHLHFERHKVAGKWNCNNIDDPMKSHNYTSPVGVGGTTSMAWYKYSSKPKTHLRLPSDGKYVSMDVTVPAPPVGGKKEDRMIYLNVAPAWKLPTNDPMYSYQTASLRVRWTRAGKVPDPTAYQDFTITPHRKEFLLTHLHWELGEKGRGGKWSVSLVGHTKSALIGTRYSKGAM